MITWDEDKRQINIKQHHIDFTDCECIFDFPLLTREDDRYAYGEQRLQSFGLLGEIIVLMCWVERADVAHIFSVRKAKKHEEENYIKQTGYKF